MRALLAHHQKMWAITPGILSYAGAVWTMHLGRGKRGGLPESCAETQHDTVARYQTKLHLIKSLYRRGWQRQDILELFRFIDWVLELPAGLENHLWNEVQA